VTIDHHDVARERRTRTGTVPRIDVDAVRDADEHHLVVAAQSGDQRALDQLLRRHYDRVHAVCRRVLLNDADAADATQDALIAIVRGLHRFDGRSSFATWAYRVTTNTCFDHLRRARRRPVTVPEDDRRDSAPAWGGPSLDVTITDRLALDEALAQLPEEFRMAVVLRDVADLDYAEIAVALGVPIGTVRSRIARGRAALAQRLGNRTNPSGRPTPDDE
jgi:RNA polymerase sigma-70 factor (ECF subfamily)